jgi:hypothetical protein
MMRWFVFLALLIPGLAHAACSDCDASAGYATVTVNGGADVHEVVEYFVIYLSDLPPSWHTAMSGASDTDGKSIRVSDSTGVTQIACYPVGVNTTTDTGCLLVDAVGMSASADVAYRVYVGMTGATMPAVTDTYGRDAVFSGYAGFYLPGMSTADLTGAGRTLTAVGTPTTDTSGYEGITAAVYNGTTQYHKYEGTPAVTDWPVTLEALAYSTDNSSSRTIFGLYQSTSWTPFFHFLQAQSSTNLIYRAVSGAATASHTAISPAQWLSLTASRDSLTTGTTRLYINGSASGTSTSDATSLTLNRMAIGAAIFPSVSNYLPGRVAMAALSSSVRSANYISTINRMWATDIYTVGAWTTSGGAGDTGWVLFQTAATTSASGTATDWSNTGDALIDNANTADAVLDEVTMTQSEYLNLTNPAYGTTIPTGRPSYTTEYRIKRRADTNAAKEIFDLTVQMIDENGTRIGSNLANGTQWPSTAASIDYTVSGVTLDGGDYDADSGLAIRANGSGTNGNTTAEVYVAWMRVTWTAPAGGDPAALTRGFFALAE